MNAVTSATIAAPNFTIEDPDAWLADCRTVRDPARLEQLPGGGELLTRKSTTPNRCPNSDVQMSSEPRSSHPERVLA